MKTFDEMTADKLRGGFYTPAPLVDICLERVLSLVGSRSDLKVLEPSVGDGAFLRQLGSHPLASAVEKFTGLEIVGSEAQKCRLSARDVPFETNILLESALKWAISSNEAFDIAMGNPPFVRFQFVSKDDLNCIEQLGAKLQICFRGVSNLWIPILLAAGSKLRVGGAMAFVVPAELFTGLAAGDARTWLLKHFTELRIDMFSPGSFPDVLQEVVIISGLRQEPKTLTGISRSTVTFIEHAKNGDTRCWSHDVPHSTQSWTRFLLTPRQISAFEQAQQISQVQQLSQIAKIEVSIVTGANEFFSVNTEEIARFQLQNWAEPLLPRIRYAEGLVYGQADHQSTVSSGAKAWLLHFDAERPDPRAEVGAARYLEIGEMRGLANRYKTSIRSPWYRVPSVWAGKLLLSKRSHMFPRLVYNAAGAMTTDTIYRGRMRDMYAGRELGLVGAFHNSLTLLSAEIEGRSFGGGVLELVPSEISRLAIPFPVNVAEFVPKPGKIARAMSKSSEGHQALIDSTDSLLVQQIDDLSPQLVAELAEARRILMQRRLNRN